MKPDLPLRYPFPDRVIGSSDFFIVTRFEA